MIVFLVSVITSVQQFGPPVPLWTVILYPGYAPDYFTFFFCAAVAISQLAHSLLAFEVPARILSILGFLFSCYLAVVLWLAGALRMNHNVGEQVVTELTTYIMFYTMLWFAARGSSRWLVYQLVTWVVWTIILVEKDPHYTTPAINTIGENWGILLLINPPWENALYITYLTLGAIYRIGALLECQTALAHSPVERWLFRLIIVAHAAVSNSSS